MCGDWGRETEARTELGKDTGGAIDSLRSFGERSDHDADLVEKIALTHDRDRTG